MEKGSSLATPLAFLCNTVTDGYWWENPVWIIGILTGGSPPDCVSRDEARVESDLRALSSHMTHAPKAHLSLKAAVSPFSLQEASTRALWPRPVIQSPSRQKSSIPLGPESTRRCLVDLLVHPMPLSYFCFQLNSRVPKKCRSVFTTVPSAPKLQPFPLTFPFSTTANVLCFLPTLFYSVAHVCVYSVHKQVCTICIVPQLVSFLSNMCWENFAYWFI